MVYERFFFGFPTVEEGEPGDENGDGSEKDSTSLEHTESHPFVVNQFEFKDVRDYRKKSTAFYKLGGISGPDFHQLVEDDQTDCL